MNVKLVYIGRALLDDKNSPRLWDVLEPRLDGFCGKGFPTLSLEGLQENGIVPEGGKQS